MQTIHDVKRAGSLFAQAFADCHDHESKDVFEAIWRDQCRELLDVALMNRDKNIRNTLEQEGTVMSQLQNEEPVGCQWDD